MSVLLPVHDAAEFVAEAARSVLDQDFAELELLVLDDGSTDGSGDVAAGLADPRLRVVRSPQRRGLVATLNAGLAEARGVWVARQDADDVSLPGRLAAQVARLEAEPDLALIGGQGVLVDATGRYLRDLAMPVEPVSLRWALLFDNPFLHSAVTFRRELIVDEFGGYAGRRYCEDFDLWSRVAARHRVANLPARVLRRRAHARSVLRAPDPERAALSAAGNRAILAQNLVALRGHAEGAEADADVLAGLREGLAAERFGRFASRFDDLRAEFESHFPEARRCRDFARTRARQWSQAAYGMRPRRLGPVARALARAVRAAPGVPFDLGLQLLRRRLSGASLPG